MRKPHDWVCCTTHANGHESAWAHRLFGSVGHAAIVCARARSLEFVNSRMRVLFLGIPKGPKPTPGGGKKRENARQKKDSHKESTLFVFQAYRFMFSAVVRCRSEKKTQAQTKKWARTRCRPRGPFLALRKHPSVFRAPFVNAPMDLDKGRACSVASVHTFCTCTCACRALIKKGPENTRGPMAEDRHGKEKKLCCWVFCFSEGKRHARPFCLKNKRN
nr:hypothetical protein [Pandoravirus massiliensis]